MTNFTLFILLTLHIGAQSLIIHIHLDAIKPQLTSKEAISCQTSSH